MLKRLKNSIFIIVIAAMMIGCVDQSGKTSSNQELKIAATSVAVTEILKELDVPASQRELGWKPMNVLENFRIE